VNLVPRSTKKAQIQGVWEQCWEEDTGIRETRAGAEFSREADSHSASQTTRLIEPEGSWPQKPTTGPHPDPDASSPQLATLYP